MQSGLKQVYAADFVDAQQMAIQYPATFKAPDLDELARLEPGQFVKVCDNGERFWVRVQSVEGEVVTGLVDNDLVCGHDYGFGNIVTFEKRHIYCIG